MSANAKAGNLAYQIQGTAGSYTISGLVEFAGPLGPDGTQDFLSGGSPLLSASLSLYDTSASGSGVSYFAADGSPMVSPSFSAGGRTFTNPPNGNDRYEITSGAVTALGYFLSSPDNYNLRLSLTGRTYEFGIWSGFSMSLMESGIYQITHRGIS